MVPENYLHHLEWAAKSIALIWSGPRKVFVKPLEWVLETYTRNVSIDEWAVKDSTGSVELAVPLPLIKFD